MRPIRATIRQGAWRHNLAAARKWAPGSKVMAVIKANGYGHGALRAAKSLSDADAFAVASIDEAQHLRRAGVDKSILVLEGAFTAEEWLVANQQHIDMVIHQSRQLDWLEQASLASPQGVWLKVDTGMHRLGMQPSEVQGAIYRLDKCPSIRKPLVMMSHLASADLVNSSDNSQQLNTFRRVIDGLSVGASMANSAAVIGLPETHFNWVRPGIMLYGISPISGTSGLELGLQPVMTLESEVIALRKIAAGETVGYCSEWRAAKASTIATVAVGYGDGYPRHAPSGTPVWINGSCYPLVGRVSMDMITVDVTAATETVSVGAPVVLWGEELPIETVAEMAGTIGYELVCQVTQRVPMVEVS